MLEHYLNWFTQLAERWSAAYGTGDMPTDMMIVVLLFSFTALIIGLLLLPSQRRGSVERLLPELERVQAMNGRLEKLDRTLNEFRTEMLRQAEMSRNEIGFLRAEVGEARDALFELLSKPGRGGSGTSGGGSQSSGGAGGSSSGTSTDVNNLKSSDVSESSPSISHEVIQQPVNEVAEFVPSGSIFSRLKKSRDGLLGKLKGFFAARTQFDQSMFDQLEETLISSDMGVKTSMQIIESVRASLARGQELTETELYQLIREQITEVLTDNNLNAEIVPKTHQDGPFVVMLVGVNGAGKTTTVAKLAHEWRTRGLTVMVAAADTFRAAAVDQLKEWAERIQVPIISGAEGAKPATVVYDAMVAAKRDKIDVLIVDTAGRLQNKSNLMQELEGIKNVMTKHQATAPDEILLVVDGSSGQNALSQAREFNSVTKLSGIVVTKLDGTPKGGIVVAIKSELNIPVRYIGVGEKREDLKVFNAAEFAGALVNNTEDSGDQITNTAVVNSTITKPDLVSSAVTSQLIN
jgi:fused signal recognition particle receptor